MKGRILGKRKTHHCGKVSSQRIWRFLHVLHPFRDLVWLLRGGPPPGPAIVNDILVLEKKQAMKIDHSDGRMRKRGVAGEEYKRSKARQSRNSFSQASFLPSLVLLCFSRMQQIKKHSKEEVYRRLQTISENKNNLGNVVGEAPHVEIRADARFNRSSQEMSSGEQKIGNRKSSNNLKHFESNNMMP